MMIVPDNLLESKTCDICHKLLTVYPVKEYPDGQVRCGRCSKNNDGGLVCKYSSFDKQGLFKCVNRFDGCRQMLRLSEVLNHESLCCSKMYECPVCLHRPSIPTFFVKKHFGKNHAQNVLDTDTFSTDLPVTGTNILLYRLKDNLFFIECKFLTPISFSLNAVFLGDKGAKSVTQKFTVKFGGEKIETETKPVCIVDGSEGFEIQAEGPYKSAIVTVHVDLADLEVVLAANTMDKPLPSVQLPRLVSLIGRHSQKFHSSGASVFAMTSKQLVEFAMHCVGCTVAVPIAYANNKCVSRTNANFGIKPSSYQFVCEHCVYYLKQQNPTAVLRLVGEVCPGLKQLKFGFSCVWSKRGCNEIKQYSLQLESHENHCKYQICQQCPVPGCNFFGHMVDISAHFESNHRTNNLFIIPKKSLFVERYDDVPVGIFIWAYHGYVWVVLSPGQTQGVYTIGIRQSHAAPAPQTSGGPQARLLVVESISGMSVLLKDEMEVTCNVDGTKVYVTGYFV